MEKSKKALIVTRVSGFVPQFEMNNIKLLQQMGYQVHYAANFDTIVYGTSNRRLEGTGIIQHHIAFQRSPFSPSVQKARRELCDLIERERFDLIHCHMPMTGVVTRLAAQKVRKRTGREVPVLYTAHGLHFYTGAGLANWIYYPVERYLARYTDRLILINEEDFVRASKFPVRGSVERTMGIGMDLSKYDDWKKPLNRKPEIDIYEKYKISREQKILISVGELTKRKNHSVMIEAMKKLGDLPVTYLICGTGPMEDSLRKRIQELGLSGRVILAGYVTNVPELLCQADCFVFPSLQEGLPVAVMEAMAVGLPVIATRIRGITDLIEHTKGGYLVHDWQPENYGVKVRRLFTEDAGKSKVEREVRRQQMGEWNRRQIQKFALPVVEEKMRHIYESVQRTE